MPRRARADEGPRVRGARRRVVGLDDRARGKRPAGPVGVVVVEVAAPVLAAADRVLVGDVLEVRHGREDGAAKGPGRRRAHDEAAARRRLLDEAARTAPRRDQDRRPRGHAGAGARDARLVRPRHRGRDHGGRESGDDEVQDPRAHHFFSAGAPGAAAGAAGAPAAAALSFSSSAWRVRTTPWSWSMYFCRPASSWAFARSLASWPRVSTPAYSDVAARSSGQPAQAGPTRRAQRRRLPRTSRFSIGRLESVD